MFTTEKLSIERLTKKIDFGFRRNRPWISKWIMRVFNFRQFRPIKFPLQVMEHQDRHLYNSYHNREMLTDSFIDEKEPVVEKPGLNSTKTLFLSIFLAFLDNQYSDAKQLVLLFLNTVLQFEFFPCCLVRRKPTTTFWDCRLWIQRQTKLYAIPGIFGQSGFHFQEPNAFFDLILEILWKSGNLKTESLTEDIRLVVLEEKDFENGEKHMWNLLSASLVCRVYKTTCSSWTVFGSINWGVIPIKTNLFWYWMEIFRERCLSFENKNLFWKQCFFEKASPDYNSSHFNRKNESENLA